MGHLHTSIRSGLFLAIVFFCSQPCALAQEISDESVVRGKQIYANECAICHMENGEGLIGAFPPLAKSDYFADDVTKAFDAILNGLEGELVVNGNTYFGIMEPVPLSDQEVADVMNFILNSWGEKASLIKGADISKWKNETTK